MGKTNGKTRIHKKNPETVELSELEARAGVQAVEEFEELEELIDYLKEALLLIAFNVSVSAFMNELIVDNWGDSDLNLKNLDMETPFILFWMLAFYQLFTLSFPAFPDYKKSDLYAVIKKRGQVFISERAQVFLKESLISELDQVPSQGLSSGQHRVPEGKFYTKAFNKTSIDKEEKKILDDRLSNVENLQRRAKKRVIDFQSVRNVTLTVALTFSYFVLKRLSEIKTTFILELFFALVLGRLLAYWFDDLSQEKSFLDLPSVSQLKERGCRDEKLRQKTKPELEEFENDLRKQNLYVQRLTQGLVIALYLSPILVLLSHEQEWLELMSDKGSSNIALKLALSAYNLVFIEIGVKLFEYVTTFINKEVIREILQKYSFEGDGITRGLPPNFSIVALKNDKRVSYLDQIQAFLHACPYIPISNRFASSTLLIVKIFDRRSPRKDASEMLYALLKTIVNNSNTGGLVFYPEVIGHRLTLSYTLCPHQWFDIEAFFELFFDNLKQAFTATKNIKNIRKEVERASKKFGIKYSEAENFWAEVEDGITLYCFEFTGCQYRDFDLTMFDEYPDVYTHMLIGDDYILIKTAHLEIFEGKNRNRHGNKKQNKFSHRHRHEDLEIKESDEKEGVKREEIKCRPVAQGLTECNESDLESRPERTEQKKKTRGIPNQGPSLFQNFSLLKKKAPVVTSWGVNGCVKVSGESRSWTHTSDAETQFADLEKDQIYDEVFRIETRAGVNYFGVFVDSIEYDLEMVRKTIIAHQSNGGCVSDNQRSTGVFPAILNGLYTYRMKPVDRSDGRFYPKYEIVDEDGNHLLIFRLVPKCHNDRGYDTSRVKAQKVINEQPFETKESCLEGSAEESRFEGPG